VGASGQCIFADTRGDAGMAVVGFESDQVRKGAGPNGEDLSVPINVAYNHHYAATLLGEGSRMERVRYDPKDPRTTIFTPEPGWDLVPVEHTPSQNGLPTSVWAGYSNGGEFRKTYKGLAPPFAQVLESPNRFSFQPMQIDTWNRAEMNLTGGAFVPGPYPKTAHQGRWPSGSSSATRWPSGNLAPPNGSDARYSGLLECPLTSRIRKKLTGGGWNDSFLTNIANCSQQARACPKTLDTAEACFEAARHVGIGAGAHVVTEQGSSVALPSGCTVRVRQAAANGTRGSVRVYFNTNTKSPVCCGSGADTVTGSQKSLVDIGLTVSTRGGVTIKLEGPAKSWFGVGFATHSMANSPYTIVVDGNGSVTERVLGDHTAGVRLSTSVQIIRHSVADGKRTLVLARTLRGLTPQHHSFDAQQLSLDFITAVGSTPTFSYHRASTVGTLPLWPAPKAAADVPATCVCSVPAAPFGRGTGTIEYLGGPAKPAGDEIGFPFRCEQYPRETVLRDQNPTCDIRTYVGGLSTCHHGWHLLDADQEIPWQDQPLTYVFKFRFYFQEYNAAHHINAYSIHCMLGIGGSVTEYDVPQCAPGTPTENCTHEISGVVTLPGKNVRFVAAHYHCHAPTCLRMEIYNNNTGELICREDPYHGRGADVTGKGSPTTPGLDRFDEAGYIAQRICLWGDDNRTFGLEPPPLVSGVPLLIKALTNSTYGHHGEMALPEMLVTGS
jgi:hypothetical protein